MVAKLVIELRMEEAADLYYKEKRRMEASPLPIDTDRLDELAAEYHRLANEHFERTGHDQSYHYYVIPTKPHTRFRG